MTPKGDAHYQVLVDDGRIWGWEDIRCQVVYEKASIKCRAMEDTEVSVRKEKI
jgi:hypothetical protein